MAPFRWPLLQVVFSEKGQRVPKTSLALEQSNREVAPVQVCRLLPKQETFLGLSGTFPKRLLAKVANGRGPRQKKIKNRQQNISRHCSRRAKKNVRKCQTYFSTRFDHFFFSTNFPAPFGGLLPLSIFGDFQQFGPCTRPIGIPGRGSLSTSLRSLGTTQF